MKLSEQDIELLGMAEAEITKLGLTDEQVKAMLDIKETDKGVHTDKLNKDQTIDLKKVDRMAEVIEAIRSKVNEIGDRKITEEEYDKVFAPLVRKQFEKLEKAYENKMVFAGHDIYASETLNTLQKVVKIPRGKIRNELATRALTYGTDDENIRKLMRASDDLQLIDATMRCVDSEYRKSGNITELAAFKRFAAIRDSVMKAIAPLDTETSGGASEWVPTGLSSEMLDLPVISGQVEGLFRHIYMPTKSYTFPLNLNGADALPQTVSESTTMVNPYDDTGGQTIVSDLMTFTAIKNRSRLMTSGELNEDSIVPVLPIMREELLKIQRNGAETGIINGDDSTTHQDTDIAALGADDCRKAFKGLRYLLLNAGTADLVLDMDESGTGDGLTQANARLVRAKAGKYALDPSEGVWLIGVKTYIEMLGFDDVRTLDKIGTLATVLRGQLAQFDGIPVVGSEYQREDVTSTGVNGASGNDYAVMMYLNKGYWFVGDRRLLTVEAERWINTDQWNVVCFRRFHFIPLMTPDATYTFGGIGIDFKAGE